MLKRFHVDDLSIGVHRLDPAQSRHLRDVLRMDKGDVVELFDAAGRSGEGTVRQTRPDVLIEVAGIVRRAQPLAELVVASAVPKGPRADWMVEKLSELGVTRLIPLHAARSVVIPEAGKRSRWGRIAEESAKQSRRSGVMQIDEVMPFDQLMAFAASFATRWCLSTGEAEPLSSLLTAYPSGPVLAAVGPEGGWTDGELLAFTRTGFRHVSLTRTILRIETAALTLAALVMCADNRKEHE